LANVIICGATAKAWQIICQLIMAAGGRILFSGCYHFPVNEGMGAISQYHKEVSQYWEDVSQTSEIISQYWEMIS